MMASAFRQAVNPTMARNGSRSVEEMKTEGHALIRRAKMAEHEKEALKELMDELLAEGFSTPEQVMKRIKVAISVTESQAAESAEMEKAVDAFHP
jgi:hypothetical protein